MTAAAEVKERKKLFERIDLRALPRLGPLERAWQRLRERAFPNAEPNIIRILWHRGLWRKLANYLLIEAQAGRRTGPVRGKPYWLTVDPTNFCQLRCPFCPTGAERKVRAKAILDFEDYKRLLDDLGPTLLHMDFMNWGEPLLNRRIFDMIAYAKRFDVDTKMDTNFNEFSEEMAEKMVLSGLDCVSLSIDGLTQETYAKYRVRGDYEKVIRHLKMLVAAKRRLGRSNPYIVWQFLVFKHNEHEAERVRQVGKELGVDVVGVTPAFLPFRPGIKDEWLPLKAENRMYDPATFPDTPPWEWEASPPARLTSDGGNGTPAHAEPAPSSGESVSGNGTKSPVSSGGEPASGNGAKPPEIDVQVYGKDKERRPLCTWPWAGITVNPNGSVSPCCSIEEDMYDFGNIFRDGFRKVWNNGHYRRSRRHVKDYVEHKVDVKTRSDHACERCFSVGRANFTFQPWWRFPQYDWWWGIGGAKRPTEGKE
jgi:radical SAM protein with 4Fe4S-binding SPASM domain